LFGYDAIIVSRGSLGRAGGLKKWVDGSPVKGIGEELKYDHPFIGRTTLLFDMETPSNL
jgi:hypothetical protein